MNRLARVPKPSPAVYTLLAAFSMAVAGGCGVGGGGGPAIPPGATNRGASGALQPHSHGALAKATPLTYADTVNADGPVAFYRLMETSGNTAHDSSSHGYDGAYHPTVAQGQTALLRSDRTAPSVSFPAGYVTETATWTNQAVSAECWMKPTAGDLATLPRIIENAWTDHSGNGFMLWISSGTLAFNTGWLQTVAPKPLRAGKTYYVAATYDNATGATLYLNGLAVANKMPGTNLPNPQQGDSSTTYIGVLQTGAQFGLNDFFQGDLADCAVYDHALSAQQIVTHYDVGADAQATAAPPPTPSPSPPPTPPPTPNPSPIAYDASNACIDGKLYTNNVLPTGEGEFATSGLDVNWWGRQRGNDIGGNQYSGFRTSWGRNQYDTWFSDPSDGLGLPFPVAYAQDTGAPGAPWGVQITAAQLPSSLAGTSAVGGAHWYSGVLDDPVDVTYGFFVARVRLPQPDPGMSPAFWLLTNNGVPQGPHGALAGEWDVQEMFGNDLGNGLNAGTILWNSGSNTPQNWGGTYDWPSWAGAAPSADYHDFGALIKTHGMKISHDYYGPGGPGYAFDTADTGITDYVNGVPLYGHTGGANVTWGVGWKELMAMFQVGAAGGWLGSPNPAQFPASYWVQWMRVYQPTTHHC